MGKVVCRDFSRIRYSLADERTIKEAIVSLEGGMEGNLGRLYSKQWYLDQPDCPGRARLRGRGFAVVPCFSLFLLKAKQVISEALGAKKDTVLTHQFSTELNNTNPTVISRAFGTS
jgi:hypothetical protein